MIVKNIVVANGAYTASDGTEKKRWLTIGALHQHEDRQYITLDAHINLAGLPRKEGETRVFANLFDPQDSGRMTAKNPSPQAKAESADYPNDDISF